MARDRGGVEGRALLLRAIVSGMAREGGFRAAVLASRQGLPLVVMPEGDNSEIKAANVALLHRVSNDIQSQLGMKPMDEVTLYDRDRTRLVCRPLTAGGDELILAIMVDPDQPYRRVTNQAVRQIKGLLARPAA